MMLQFKIIRILAAVLFHFILFVNIAGAQDNSILKVRGDKDYPPFEYLNEQGIPEGFNIDVFKAAAGVMELEYEIELGAWHQVRTDIENGKVDILLGMYRSGERDKLVDFSIPHFISTYVVFVRKGSDIFSVDDIYGKKIGAQRDDIGHDYLIENSVSADIKSEITIKEVLDDLAAGKTDCAFLSRLQGLMLIKNHNIKGIEPVGNPVLQRKYGFAVTEGRGSLLSVLNEGLSIIKTSGEYDEIYEKWFGVYTEPDFRRITRYIFFSILPLIVIILIVVLWNWSLKKQVSVRTDELRMSREDYRTTLNSIGDAVITTDTGGRIKRLNPVAEQLTGWSITDARGLPLNEVFKIVDAETREPLDNPVGRVLTSGLPAKLQKKTVLISRGGGEYPVSDSAAPIRDEEGNINGVVFVFRDITEEYQIKEALQNRLVALTQPPENFDRINFEVMFNIEEIQKLQDDISRATGLSSSILSPDGQILTRPSNLANLCFQFFRKTEKGLSSCLRSDAEIISGSVNGPYLKRCGGAGLWDAGTRIIVAGRHIATWVVGQARDPAQTEEDIRSYARKIGCDEDAVAAEFLKLPVISEESLRNIITAIHTVAKQLSDKAYQNIQLARFIREKSESEEEMRLLQNYLSNILDSMPSMLIGVDPECRVTQWNHAAEEDSGLSAKEAIGQRLTEVLPWMEGETGSIEGSIRTSEPRRIRRRARRTNGKRVYENITIFPLQKGYGDGAVILIDDVSSSVQMEDVMIQSEKMLSVGGLAAGMAHEINNPMAGMIQTASVMSNRLLSGKDIPANRKAAEEAGITSDSIVKYMELRGIPRMLDSINEAGSRVAAIVENMLTFARKSESFKSTHSITEIVNKSIELARTDYNLKKNYDFRKIKITLEYKDNLPEIICESGELQQVVLNILRNGAQAMQHKDDAESEFHIKIDEWPEGPGVRVQIADNGPGMDEETRRRLFEPFYTTKAVGLGTGLGLSVSYYIIVDNHHGELTVESEPGNGAVFIIKLPMGGGADG